MQQVSRSATEASLGRRLLQAEATGRLSGLRTHSGVVNSAWEGLKPLAQGILTHVEALEHNGWLLSDSALTFAASSSEDAL